MPVYVTAWHADGTECGHGWDPDAPPALEVFTQTAPPVPRVTCHGGQRLTGWAYSNNPDATWRPP